jgi:hypothetical protein
MLAPPVGRATAAKMRALGFSNLVKARKALKHQIEQRTKDR